MHDWINTLPLGDILHHLYLITAIGVVVVVLLENRNPLKTLAWVLVLLWIPLLGLILYFFFGQNTRRLIIIKRSIYRRIMQRPPRLLDPLLQTIPDSIAPLVHLNYKNAHAPIYKSEPIEIYHKGTDYFEAIIQSIKEAKHHIHLLFYIFEADNIGREIQQLLIQKAKEGVEVRVIVDDVGCWQVPYSFFRKMKKNGVHVHRYLRVVFPFFTSKANYRNHRKVLVIDGTIGYIGGNNIADRYVNGNHLGPWRDTHIRIEGPAVRGLQSTFLIDWHTVSKEIITGEKYFPALGCLPNTAPLLQIVAGGPIDAWPSLLHATTALINKTQRYLYIQTPYFLPSEGLEQALQMASRSGVDVRIMMSYQSDTFMAGMASRSYIKQLLKAGIKVYLYKEGFLHSKVILSDDHNAIVGSTNFDYRSYEHNFEANAFIYDQPSTIQLRKLFEQDINKSIRVEYKEWSKRAFYKRIVESIARLASPVL